MKKNCFISLLALVLSIACFAPTVYGEEPIQYKRETLTFSGGSRTVNYVTVDLKQEGIQVHAAVAKNQVGAVASLAEIAQQLDTPAHRAVAAINGTYFSAYQGLPIPYGDIIQDGEFLHLGNTGSTIGISEDNQVFIQHITTRVEVYINGLYRWNAWNINNYYHEPQPLSILIYTPHFGETTYPHETTSLV